MKQHLILVFILLTNMTFLLNSCVQKTVFYAPENDKIQYEGRINFSDTTQPAFAFPGTSIKAKFNGTAVSVKLKGYAGNGESNYFNVFIDDVFVKKFELETETKIEICQENLPKGIHTIEINKRTESFLGKVDFLGFEIAGTLLKSNAKPTRKIEFIGNSITCGYGNEDVSTSGFVAALENNHLAYGAICARELNAEYRAIAYSGRGVVFNFGCLEDDVMPQIYEKYFADEPISENNQYDHKSYTPDVIVINLGTNDHACDSLSYESFITAYVDFIFQLRVYHPKAKIVCLSGPMNSTEKFKKRVEVVVTTCGGEDNDLYFFHQTPTIDEKYAGGHGHPNTLMAAINGKEVAAFIKSKKLFAK